MGRPQHANVIEPPNRTAHNLAYAAESLIQVVVYAAVALMLFFIRSWSLVPFMLMATLGLLIVAQTPLLVTGRLVDRIAQRQSTRSAPTEEKHQP